MFEFMDLLRKRSGRIILLHAAGGLEDYLTVVVQFIHVMNAVKDIADLSQFDISLRVHDAEFVEEYRGEQVPKGKKSLMFRFRLASETGTLTADEIERLRHRLIKKLKHVLDAEMR